MEPYDTSILVIHSACGDVQALKKLLNINEASPLTSMTALLALSHDIHPLATLITFVRTEDPPEWLRDRACSIAPEAVRILLEPEHDSLRAELGANSYYIQRVAESLTSLKYPLNETNKSKRNAPNDFVGRLMVHIGATRWEFILSSARAILINAVILNPQTAAIAGGAVWDALNETEQISIALAVSNAPSCAVDLIASIGAGGWLAATHAARAALIDAIARDPQAAANAGCAVWTSLDASEREIIAHTVASNAESAASFVKGIGVEGWKIVSDDAKKAILNAIVRYPWSMSAFCETMWPAIARDSMTSEVAGTIMYPALFPDERIAVAEALRDSPNGAAHLIDVIGAEEWNASPAVARSLLISAIAQQPKTAWAGGRVWASLTPDEQQMIALAAAAEPSTAANLMERIGADGWAVAPAGAKAALLLAIGRDPESALRGGGLVWNDIDHESRSVIAYAAAINPDCAANLMERIGADGWAVAPAGAKAALLLAVTHVPKAAARGGAAVWTALEPDDVCRISQCAVQAPDAVVELLKRIGAGGWRRAPKQARAALLKSIAHSPELMIRCVSAVWTGMVAQDYLTLGRNIAGHPHSACRLMRCCEPKQWRAMPDSMRNDLISAVTNDPRCAAVGGGAVWAGLDLKHQKEIICAVANEPFDSAHLMKCIGVDEWMNTPDNARAALIAAVASDAHAALHAAGALWTALSPVERVNLVSAAAQSPSAADETMQIIGVDAWHDAPEQARTHLLKAESAYDTPNVSALTSVWTALKKSERNVLVKRMARSPVRLANLVSQMGPDMWASLPVRVRMKALRTITRHPFEAAKVAIVAWSALRPAERAMLVQSAACDPFAAQPLIDAIGPEAWTTLKSPLKEALLAAVSRTQTSAARAFLVIGDVLDDERRIDLACAALERKKAGLAIARLLHEGRPWRAWMTFFAPSEADDAAYQESWSTVISHTPIHVSARLARQQRNIR